MVPVLQDSNFGTGIPSFEFRYRYSPLIESAIVSGMTRKRLAG